MSSTTIASGLGATLTAKQQASWGGTFMSTAYRTLPFKTAKMTLDPHVVQGGPYLANQLAALASTRVLTWTDAKVTITGDVFTTGHALLFASALGSSAVLTQLGTTGAYALGGAAGAALSDPSLNSTWLDMQLGIPDDSGTVHPFSFHSGGINKAEWVFDRGQIVSYTYDLVFQQVETATALLSPSEPTSQVPFTMATTAAAGAAIPAGQSGIALGTKGAETIQAGIKKATLTLTRKWAQEADRMYLGLQFQESPVPDDYFELQWALETNYTASLASGLYELLLSGASTSVVAQAANPTAIGGTNYPTLAIETPAFFVDDPSSVPSPDGPKLIASTITGTCKIDSAGDPVATGTLVTADTTF